MNNDVAARLLKAAQDLPEGDPGFSLLCDALGEIVRLRNMLKARAVVSVVPRSSLDVVATTTGKATTEVIKQ